MRWSLISLTADGTREVKEYADTMDSIVFCVCMYVWGHPPTLQGIIKDTFLPRLVLGMTSGWGPLCVCVCMCVYPNVPHPISCTCQPNLPSVCLRVVLLG